jgi:hypothetical protein
MCMTFGQSIAHRQLHADSTVFNLEKDMCAFTLEKEATGSSERRYIYPRQLRISLQKTLLLIVMAAR